MLDPPCFNKSPLKELDLNVFYIKINDEETEFLAMYFQPVYEFINKYIKNNEPVLVHCQAGRLFFISFACIIHAGKYSSDSLESTV